MVDVPMRFETEPLLLSVENVYSAAECARFIDLIEESAPTLATNNPLYRDQDRVVRDDPEIAGDLFGRLRSALPARIGDPPAERPQRTPSNVPISSGAAVRTAHGSLVSIG